MIASGVSNKSLYEEELRHQGQYKIIEECNKHQLMYSCSIVLETIIGRKIHGAYTGMNNYRLFHMCVYSVPQACLISSLALPRKQQPGSNTKFLFSISFRL